MRTVECTIEIDLLPEKILTAFTDEAMLKEWWGVEKCFIELKKEGLYTLGWGISEQGIKYVSTGVIKNYEPGKLLHIGDYMYLNSERPFLGPLNLIIETRPAASGTVLKLTQGPYPEGKGEHWNWYYEVVKEAWPKVLGELKKYLQEKFPA